MRISILFVIILLAIQNIGLSQSKTNQYQYTVDLTNVVNDRLFVELIVPTIAANEITFFLPKIIPGTYAIEDYGRYVSDFSALDKKGKPLEVEKTGTNSWKIKNSTKLFKITYWLDDSFDTDKGEPKIFEPAGTNIETNNIILNNGGLFGYFEGMKNIPFAFNILHDKDFYGSTGLIATQTGVVTKIDKEKPESSNKRLDAFRTENYDRLVDSPIMYARADTAIIKVANTEVLISSYSPNKKITAKEIASNVREILMAQKEFLGGKLPVEKYAFIFYWTDKPVTSYGALEHSYSSLYFMPELTIEQTSGQLRDFAAHEFFHIVTPLTIHSEEIHQFDFNDPKISKHLWLYEGVTEYFAGLVQVKYGLQTQKEYLADIQQKMIIADRFLDDVPFTDISQYTLDKYKEQYSNVYLKGALIGLCLDVKLLSLSKGKYGLQNLIADLSKKYGKAKAFKDDELFDQITALTYPEIGEFFKKYVSGPEKLPLPEVLESVGISYSAELKSNEFTTGLETKAMKILERDGKDVYQIKDPSLLNDQGKALNLAAGDIVLKINGEPIPTIGPELQPYFNRIRENMKEGETLSITVLREDENKELKEITLQAPIKKIERKKKHNLEVNPNASPEQIELRNVWLSGK